MKDLNPRDEGDLEPVDVVDDEDLELDDISPSVDDDTIDDDPPNKKTVPYERFKDVNDKLRDIEARYKAATAAKKAPETKEEPSSKNYSPDQIKTVQELAGTEELRKKLEAQEERWAELERQEALKADQQERKEAVKDKTINPHGFKEDQIQKQVVKWGNSGDPDKEWLARAPYHRIIKEMSAMYEAKQAKKGDNPPAVSTSGAPSPSKPRDPEPVDDKPSNTPPNPLTHGASLGRRAVDFMKSLDAGDSE